MILLIDNYDSFSYNLYQLVAGECKRAAGAFSGLADRLKDGSSMVMVIRNDDMTIKEMEELRPDAIVLSPGPGRPADAGVCLDVVRYFTGKLPILGVCLGHQAICEALGGKITYADELMHGKKKRMRQVAENKLFAGIPEVFEAARYHSLIAEEGSLPAELIITARSVEEGAGEGEPGKSGQAEKAASGCIMAVEHRDYPVFGLQFHPESVMTADGAKMIQNFLKQIERDYHD